MAFLTAEYFAEEKPGPKLFDAIEVKGWLRSHHTEDPVSFEAIFELVSPSQHKEVSERTLGEWRFTRKDPEAEA